MSAGQMTASDRLHERIDHLEQEKEELVEALARLAGEMHGCLGMSEAVLRRELGNTNYHCLEVRTNEARDLLKKVKS